MQKYIFSLLIYIVLSPNVYAETKLSEGDRVIYYNKHFDEDLCAKIINFISPEKALIKGDNGESINVHVSSLQKIELNTKAGDFEIKDRVLLKIINENDSYEVKLHGMVHDIIDSEHVNVKFDSGIVSIIHISRIKKVNRNIAAVLFQYLSIYF